MKRQTQFDEEQLAAIESTSSNVVVLASPGSGKSTTLIGRINHLIEDCGVKPAEIVAITFTNRAGAVLREKLGRPIGYVGTIHSFCYSLIRKFIGELTIVLDDEREALIAAIIVEQRYKGTMKAVQEAIQKRDRTNLVYCAYKRRLAENGMIDFDGILETGLDVITKFKDELKYTDLLVDE